MIKIQNPHQLHHKININPDLKKKKKKNDQEKSAYFKSNKSDKVLNFMNKDLR